MKTISSRSNPIVRARFRELASERRTPTARGCCSTACIWCATRTRPAATSKRSPSPRRGSTASTEEADAGARARSATACRCVSVTDIGLRRDESGAIAVRHRRDRAPHADRRSRRSANTRDGFVLVAVDVQDPGNLGALIRAAEAGGVTGVLVVRRVRESVLVEGAARQHGQRIAAAGRASGLDVGRSSIASQARRRPNGRAGAARRTGARTTIDWTRPRRRCSSAAKVRACRRRRRAHATSASRSRWRRRSSR